MTQADHCQGVHIWYPVESNSSHNLRPVPCKDYVAALEQQVLELGGNPKDAFFSCMAGGSSDTRLHTADTTQMPPAALCSMCRQAPPDDGHRWCAECLTDFLWKVGLGKQDGT